MKIEVTREQLEKICEINEALKGTRRYGEYQMFCEVRGELGNWISCCWGCPRISSSDFNGAYIKDIRGTKYIYCQEGYMNYGIRYCLTMNVAELFGWEI